MPQQQEAGRAFRHRLDSPFWRRVMFGGLKTIPQSVQRATMPLWGGLFWSLIPEARRRVEQNLIGVLGEMPPDELRRRSYRTFVNYAQAIANLYVLHLGQDIPVQPEFVGYEQLKPLLAEKRGAVTITGHLGFWQITPFLCAKRDWLPQMTMAMAEEPNQATRAFEEGLRKKFRIVYTTASPFASIELANVLRRGELVGMQMDRHLGGAHAMVPFCGRPAPFPLGPATLARATRAPLLPVFVVASPDRRTATITLETPIEVAHTRDRERDVYEATVASVAVYERYVKANPEQWFNFHDFWQAPAQGARSVDLRRAVS